MERFFRNLRVFGVVMCALFVLIAAASGLLLFFRERLPFSLPVFSTVSDSQASSDMSSPEGMEDGFSRGESTSSSPVASDSSEEEPDSGVFSGEDADPTSSESEKDVSSKAEEPASSEPEEPAENKPVVVRKPELMHAVYLYPGVDYPVTGDENAICAKIDAALDSAQQLEMNTVVALLYGEVGAIYQTSLVQPANSGVDVLRLLSERVRERGMYFYALYEAAAYPKEGRFQVQAGLDVPLIDFAAQNAKEIAGQYVLDGLLIDSFYNETSADSYANYIRSGAGTGYLSYMRCFSESLCMAVRDAFRQQSPATQIGLVVDGVWENASVEEDGPATSQSFTSLGSGNADTRKLACEGGFDFVVMRPGGSTDSTTEPFLQVAEWWNAQAAKAGIPLYILHPSDKICTDAPGYQSPDELVQQIIYARDCSCYEGSIFNSLSRLGDNPQSSTDLLVALFEDRVNVSHVLTELAVSTPEKTTFSTFEPVIVFRGASDPTFDVTLNGQALDTDADGYFTTNVELQPGENVFTFEHKGKALTYRITRNVQIIQEVSPSGAVEADGGMRLQVTALAYKEASVTATLGGMSITLTHEVENDDDTDANSSYTKFSGEFTLPAAAASVQNLGVITVQGAWQGISDSMQGASVAIKKVVAAGDGDLIIVTADSAKTFPVDTLNNESNPDYFPLPKGTKDYAIGDRLSFTNSSGTYYYYQLQSGVRVYAEDVSKIEGDITEGNAIRGMKISSDVGYTYVRLATDQPVPYLVTYRSDGISFDFRYTTSTPDALEVPDNPVIRAASWSGSRLTLSFTKSGSFLGYHAYYEGDTLVLRLTNPPTRLRNVRVAIDPGHGGKDRGASGYYPDMDEKDVNLAIAKKTADALEGLGIQVKLIQTDPYLTLTQRIEAARTFDADIFLSIHSNSSVDSAARGTEVYYFYPNAQQLASAISGRVASALDTTNRGGKAGRYVVTTDSRFASVLIECGFISNKNEYKKLTDSAYQRDIASGIAQGVQAYIEALSTGIAGGQGEDVSAGWEDGGQGQEGEAGNEAGDTSSEETAAFSFSETDFTLEIDEGLQLTPDFGLEGDQLHYLSEDDSVVTVDEDGWVEAVGAGETVIEVWDEESGQRQRLYFTVEEEES